MNAVANSLPTRAEFVERISGLWHRSREYVLALGRALLDAKASLAHGEFTAMIDADLPFGPDTARQLMRITGDPRLASPNHDTYHALPESPAALDVIRRLDDETMATAISVGDIHPKMTVADAKALIGKPRPAAHVEARTPENLRQPIIGPTDWAATMKGYRLVSGRSQLEIDERSGLQSGYTGKLEIDVRRDWNESAWDRLNGLGLVMILVPAVDAVRADTCPCCGAVKR